MLLTDSPVRVPPRYPLLPHRLCFLECSKGTGMLLFLPTAPALEFCLFGVPPCTCRSEGNVGMSRERRESRLNPSSPRNHLGDLGKGLR